MISLESQRRRWGAAGNDLLTLDEVAAMTGLAASTLRNLSASGEGPAIILRSRLRRADVLDWIEWTAADRPCELAEWIEGPGDAVESKPKKPAKKKTSEPTDDELAVISHINAVTGRRLKQSSPELKTFLEKYSVDDAKKIIDHLWAKWGKQDDMRHLVDTITPFRPKKAHIYLDSANNLRANSGGEQLQMGEDYDIEI